MQKIQIVVQSIVDAGTDAVVNAANSGLWEGSGVCGAIFQAAGAVELTDACRKIGHCAVGDAVITPGFRMNAKYIIHAVGPQWKGGSEGEEALLFNAYRNALERAKEVGCHSIAFPLISAGIYGVPSSVSWEAGFLACNNFFQKNLGYDMAVSFAVLDEELKAEGMQIWQNRMDGPLTPELDQKAQCFFRETLILLKAIANDEALSKWFREYSAYTCCTGYEGLQEIILLHFIKRAYDDGLISIDYNAILKGGISLKGPYTAEWLSGLSKVQILACVVAHFRADHFDNGSLYRNSLGRGLLAALFEEYLKRCG